MLHVFETFDAGLIDGMLSRPEDVAQILQLLCEEVALLHAQRDACVLQSPKDIIHVSKILLKTFRKNDEIIEVYQPGLLAVSTQ